MSETKPLTLSDLIKGDYSNVTMDAAGIIEVPPFNRAPNQYFRDLTHRGMPRFWQFPVPPKKRGHYAYVSMPGYFPTKQGNDPPRKGTLSRQTNRPILMDQGSYVGNKPWVGEMSPIRSRIHAMPGLAKPLRPEVDVIASQLTGYRVVEGQNTTYGFAFDLGDGKGGWTTLSGMARAVMAPEDSGKGFRFFVPPDTGEAVFLRIHMTKPNGGADTLRAQRIVPLPHPDGYVDLEGPYLDSGDAPQDENTTVLEAPTPDVTGDDADVFLARGPYGVRAGYYNFYYQLGDERGPGLLGPASEMVPVEGQIDKETDTENHTYHADEATNRINVNNNPFVEDQEVSPRAPAPDPLEGGKSYFVRDVAGNSFKLANTRGGPAINITENGSGTITGEVTREVQRDYVSDMAFHVRTPKGLAPGQRWTVWCFKVPFGGGTGTFMRLHRKRSTENIEELYGRNDRGDVRRDTFQIYGFSPESEPIALRNGLIEETPPTEDFTGLPNPDFLTPPEEPLVVELDTVETPSDFLFAVSAVGYPGVVDRREESVVSEVVQKRILAGETYRIIPKKSTNQLPNAEFTEVKSNHDGPFEVPADWVFTDGFPAAAAGDRRWFSADGVGTVNTNQTLSTGLYVHSKPYRLPGGSDVKVSVKATMTCDRWASGTTDLIVRQLDDEGNRLASNVILSLSSVGTVTTPEGGVQLGAGGEFPWAQGVDKIIFRLKASDGTWNMKVDIQDLAFFPFEEAIRKVEEGEPGRPARPRPSPALPYPTSSFVAIGLPPVPPGATTSTSPAVEVVDFEDGIPGVWTVTEAPTANTDILVEGPTPEAPGVPAIHGNKSLLVKDENRLNNSTLYVQRTYTDAAMGDSDSMAFRFLMLVEKLPSTPDYHRILTMAPDPVRPGNSMAILKLSGDGRLVVTLRDGDGSFMDDVPVISNVANGDLLDVEVNVTGNTPSGNLVVTVGKNGASREPRAVLEALDYAGRIPRVVRLGIVQEAAAAAKATYRFDQLVTTKRGDVLDRESRVQPAGTPSPPKDRPRRVDLPRASWAERTDYEVGNTRMPSESGVGFGHFYEVVRAGKSVGAEPVFSTEPQTNTRDVNGLVPIERNTHYIAGAARLRPAGNTGDNNWWRCIAEGDTDPTTNPGYPEPANVGDEVLDGTARFRAEQIVVWKEAGTIWREFEEEDRDIYQMYGFIEEGEAGGGRIKPSDDYGPRLVYPGGAGDPMPLSVEPGETYTVGVWARQTVFNPAHAPHPFFLTLRGYGKGPIPLGSVYREGGAATSGWVERWFAFKVPDRINEHDPGYTELYIDSRDMAPGVYVFQEVLIAEGNLTSHADRDEARGYGRPLAGSFVITLSRRLAEGLPEDPADAIGPERLPRWATLGARASSLNLPAPNKASFTFRSGPTRFGPWSTRTSDKFEVPEDDCLQIAGEIQTDGRNSPRILPGDLWLEMLHPGDAILTDENRESLPGLALIGYSPTAYRRGEYEVITVDNHPFPIPKPDEVTRIPPLRIQVTDEETLEYLLELTPNEVCHIEAPFSKGTGMIYRGRFYDLMEPPEEARYGALQAYRGKKRLSATITTPAFEAEEAWPMPPYWGSGLPVGVAQ